MANVNFVNATLRLKYVDGYDENNEPTFTTKSYRNINNTHSADDLLAVAYAIASLSSQSLAGIAKQETHDLS
ncbi:DUF1659 domain-containing protein [Lysinibacillus sp. HST-98]|jgi:Protein of unknown function (DUF1659)|nr:MULTISPECIES: DUF1659 domain-containing protein [Lysinibacillus]EFI68274.1 hypothetical protein BFZC1_12708 [Lysinibacillus fusiformis ZC1]EKU40768.1 hypothetical protein C518_4266 [Lysinibacillus fusiformis ZB2]AUS86311.1 DUF1659 domain-containing protein [Lysinibacillus sp. YS11]MBL3729857.1 DUF1659 domain-containing protein [Lysinibacillus sp. HST-98]MBU5251480.1 DUF1659 domain-containing protein [Lysinibacillus capsici]